MSKSARVVFRFTIQGNGRDQVVNEQPLSPNPDFSKSTDGAVSYNSPALFGQYILDPGWTQLLDPAGYIASPMVRNYFAFFPALGGSGQSLPPVITLAGATTDVGVGLNPNTICALALPAGAVGIYVQNPGSTSYLVDTWQW